MIQRQILQAGLAKRERETDRQTERQTERLVHHQTLLTHNHEHTGAKYSLEANRKQYPSYPFLYLLTHRAESFLRS